MSPLTRRVVPAVLLALAACGTSPGERPESPRPAAETPEADDRPLASPAAATAAELEALYWARVDSARTRFTDADVRFMTGMIAHHAQAIVMSRLAATNGASPPVRTLAARIISAQEDEIELMQRWLQDRGQPVPEPLVADTPPAAHAADHVPHVPGMLSANQLRALERAHGPVFDRLFLLYMIQHHRGAVEMVRGLFATDRAARDPSVSTLASEIQVDQTTEIGLMRRLLAELPAEARPR